MDMGKLEAIETASVDEVRALQLERMKAQTRHAYDNQAFYRAKCEEAGVHPDDLKAHADLARFPFTVKQDFRDNYPFGMFAVPTDKVMRVHASSGTTGKPTVVGYTANDVCMWAGLIARCLRAAGTRPGDKVHIAFGYGLFTGGLGFHHGAELLGATVIPMSVGQTERQVKLIEDFQPDVITVTPSYLLNIADEMDRQGVDPAKLALRVAVCGAEPWTEAMRDEIEERLALKAFDTYGLSEVIGPGMAQECAETRDGPTIWEDHFYPEVIDPETGKSLPDGEIGELVMTSLTKEACPVIRYRTRDLTRLMPGTARPMRRVERVTGRSDDMLIIRGVNLFPSQVEEQILSIETLAPHFQIEVVREGQLDGIIVNIELKPGAGDDAGAAAADELKRKCRSFIGVSPQVMVRKLGEIARSEGKAVRVIDRRK